MNRFTAASSFSVIRAFRRHWLREATAALLVAGLLLQSVQAVAPGWWTARGVFKAGASADDYAAANVGQLKHLAQKAAAQLNDVLPGGAGAAIDGLIASWSAAPAPGVTRDDYAAVSVGQLKRVAKPFYDRLGLTYPWGSGLATDDFALANVGQLKRVFSFLVPDSATLGLTDTDGDGFSDVLEFTAGTNPYLASSKPAGGGDVPPGGGTDPGGGSQPGWTPAQLAAADAAYEVGLQERSVGLGTEIEYAGGEPNDPDGVTVEKTYRVYPAWDEEPVWVAGPYSQAAHGSNNVPAAELANGATVVHDAVGGYSLPDWDWEPGDPVTGAASLAGSGWVEATAFGWAGVATGKAEFRLLRRLKEGVTAPVDAEGNLIKPEIKRTFLKVTTILPEPSGGPLAPEVVTFTIPAGQDVATTTSGVLFPPVTTAGTHRVELLSLEIDVAKISHNVASVQLEDCKKEAIGAFVPLNSDDDDYSATFANFGSDKDQAGAITGENDLLPIYLRKVPQPTGAKFLLDIPSKIKVWKNSNRQDEVLATTEFDANVDTTVYAEGVIKGSDLLKLTLRYGGQDKANIDRLKITVFELKGVLNVPGYSAYSYTADGSPPTGSKWGTPTGGSVKSGSTATQATILWDEGPVVGKAVYEVNSDYTWDWEVNVVQVKLATGATNKVVYGGGLGQNGQLIRSSTTGKAMEASLTIDKVIGPSVSGLTRGEQFLEAGFIQNGTFTRKHALYDGFTPKKRRRSSLQDGTDHIDYITSAPASTAPWYDSADATGSDGFHQVPGGGITSHALNVSDTPAVWATDAMTLTVGATSDLADKFAIEFDFNLYFAVRTVQDVNGSRNVFTQRGRAAWEFDGSGDINASGVWTQTGAGNTGSASFAEVTSGDVVPVTTGAPLNTLFGTETWTTENQ